MFFILFATQSFADTKTRQKVGETTKDMLKRLYKNHTSLSYSQARTALYNKVDCVDDNIQLEYGGSKYPWKCGGTSKPPATDVNAEHTVPQSLFAKRAPMVSDLHHIFAASTLLNRVRSNYKFGEFDYNQCDQFCTAMSCSRKKS